MTSLDDPEENLRTIRQLMERATVYRAIAGPVALGAGLLATLNCLAFFYQELMPDTDINDPILGISWITSWYIVLALVVWLNTCLLWKHARSNGEALFSQRMRTGLKALAPPLLAGFLIGLKSSVEIGPTYLSDASGAIEYVWLLFYGLALSATGSFAPASIRYLGYSLVTLSLVFWIGSPDSMILYDLVGLRIPPGLLAMLTGFGISHIIYGSCVPWKAAAIE